MIEFREVVSVFSPFTTLPSSGQAAEHRYIGFHIVYVCIYYVFYCVGACPDDGGVVQN
jgi:hypothetical protein